MKTGKKSNFAKAFEANYAKNYAIFSNKKAKLVKNSIFQYVATFVVSFIIGLLAAKIAIPVSQTYADTDLKLNEKEDNSALLIEKETAEKREVKEIANANISTSYANSYTTSANNASYANSGLYMPSIGFYSGVSTANVSNNTVQVPASGVAKIGSLLVGHNPGTFSAILNLKQNDVFYLYGQKYQVTAINIFTVSDDMSFVGKETTSSLSNGSKGLVLMTCYGQMRNFTLRNGSVVKSASHRFIVYAQAV